MTGRRVSTLSGPGWVLMVVGVGAVAGASQALVASLLELPPVQSLPVILFVAAGTLLVWLFARPGPRAAAPSREGDVRDAASHPAESSPTGTSGEPPFPALPPARVKGAHLDAVFRALRAATSRPGLPGLDWVEVEGETVDLVLQQAETPPAGFELVGERIWRTRSAKEKLGVVGPCSISPATAVVPVGRTGHGAELLLDLESSGAAVVEGPGRWVGDLLRSIAVSAVRIPWPEQPRVVLVGMDGALTNLGWVSREPSLAAALTKAETHARRVRAALAMSGAASLGEARARGSKGESWAALVVVSARAPQTLVERQRVRELVMRRNSGVALVTPAAQSGVVPGRRVAFSPGGPLVVDGMADVVLPRPVEEVVGGGMVDLDRDAQQQLIDQGRAVRQALPAAAAPETRQDGTRPDQATRERAVLTNAVATNGTRPGGEAPTELRPPATTSAPAGNGRPAGHAGPAAETFSAAEGGVRSGPAGGRDLSELMTGVDVLIRVLGHVEAVRLTRAGSEAAGVRPDGEVDGAADRLPGVTEVRLSPGRPKALEAVVYLALREAEVDRDGLEIRLFPDGTNAPKTLYNVVSAARALVGEEQFPAPESGRYVLAESVTTDYGLFCDLIARADECQESEVAIAHLTDALSLVRGEPFMGAGRNYTWAGPHRNTVVADVTDAAEELAEIHLALGDWRAAEWAARRGLRAFPSDERLYRLLMRAAAAAGNSGAVKRVFTELCGVLSEPGEELDPTKALHPLTLELVEQLQV